MKYNKPSLPPSEMQSPLDITCVQIFSKVGFSPRPAQAASYLLA